MANTAFIGTRKGLLTLSRRPRGWEITNIDFLGQPVTMLLEDPRDGWRYACLTLGHFGVKLWRSPGEGQPWEECPVPVYPAGAEIFLPPGPDGAAGKSKPANLKEIWALEAGGADQPGRLWAGTIPGALFRSDDRGSSWQLVDSLWNREERKKWFGGGKDEPGIHSICVDPRDSRKVSVGVSCGGMWVTEDDGATWACRANGMRAAYMPPELAFDPDIQDVHRLAQSPARPDVMWVQHHNGVFHTTDGGGQWREIEKIDPSTFGFAVVAHPRDPLSAWFAPATSDEVRVPVEQKLVVTRTRDGGQSFESLTRGLPQHDCFDLVFRHGLDIDESGERLVMGSSTGGLWISENGGDDWQAISTTLPQIYSVRFARG